MTARMRGKITERAEKGLGPINFKRLLLAGGSAALCAMVLSRLLGFLPGCASALIVLLLALLLTHPIEGMAFSIYALRAAQSLAAISAYHAAQRGEVSTLSNVMKVEPDAALFDADTVYEAEWQNEDEGLGSYDLTYAGGFQTELETGLSLVESPFSNSNHR